ncbi:MAG: DotU family type IV/VI secretion system protein [Phycisphaerales bacterium]
MTRLAELCEPLLQYVCRLSRSARKGVALDRGQVRADVRALLVELTAQGRDDAKLGDQFEKVRLPLTVFVDEMVGERIETLAEGWVSLADEIEGREVEPRVFFDALEDGLSDQTPSGAERVEVLHTCLGLGFTGGRTEGEIQGLLERTTERLRPMMDADPASRVCPEAYEHVDTSDLIQPAGRSVTGIAVALCVLLIVVIVGNAVIYRAASSELRGALQTILNVVGGGR